MTIKSLAWMAALVVQAVALTVAQSVYPTGTTIYDPDRAWNGYTVLSPLGTQAVLVIDMNGNVVKRWDGYNNSAGGPARVLPGGFVVAASGANPPHQESLELVERNFAGAIVWRFSHAEQVKTREGDTIWSARQHHDWQRESFPAGYYAPGSTPAVEGGNTLILTHTTRTQAKVTDALLEDDRLIEVSWSGEIGWEWLASDHIDELGFAADARQAIKAAGSVNTARGAFDWLHINSATYVGPNRWFDQGDTRFAPNNVIISSREASLLAIVGRDGSIVWRLGPDFSASKELRAIRQIIGQHHAHFIPKGLPGGKSAGVRQRRRQRLWLRQSHRARGQGRVCPPHLACPRDQPGDARAGVVLYESKVLQHEHQQRAAVAERQYARHRRRRRADVRGDEGRRDRLGIHVSAVCRRQLVERRVSGLPRPIRLDSAAGDAQRAARHPSCPR
jgi:hypothetical protein